MAKINYTAEEKAVFADLIEKHKCLPILSSSKRDKETKKRKANMWEMILKEYNDHEDVKTKVCDSFQCITGKKINFYKHVLTKIKNLEY